MSAYETISVQQLNDLQKRSPLDVIDVRTPAEYREVHVDWIKNLPLDSLDPSRLASEDQKAPLYVMCRSGQRASMACKKINATGQRKAICVVGGMIAWEEAGFDVQRGKKTISLERQVRIAAGSLVLIGIALAYFVSPLWIGLSAFVGTGLLFAGITDTCGMGILLSRMPWNHVRSTSPAPTACKLPTANNSQG